MLITSLLGDYNILENRGNNNVRAFNNNIEINKNPDFLLLKHP